MTLDLDNMTQAEFVEVMADLRKNAPTSSSLLRIL